MNSNTVVDMFIEIGKKIESEKDYVTELDAILGDGDHWVNINKGYKKIVSMEEQLRALPLEQLFRTVGMSIMSTVGGSSGVLYGDAFITGSRVLKDVEEMDLEKGCEFLATALEAMMNRGKAQPGDKTMLDPLHQTVEAIKQAIGNNADREIVSKLVIEAANKGMEDTKEMVARKGRATYREDKGVGYIDAGAATMCYQLEIVGKYMGLAK